MIPTPPKRLLAFVIALTLGVLALHLFRTLRRAGQAPATAALVSTWVAPRTLDICAARRPDGMYPAACAQVVDWTAGAATLLFAGDTAPVDAALPVLEREGFDHAFGGTIDLLREADLSVVNLEAPIADRGEPIARMKEYLYRAPAKSAAAIARAGVDLVSLANNHTMDYGAVGLLDTIDNLEQVGVAAIGGGADEASARRGIVVRVGRLRVGVISRCERQLDWDLYVGQFAEGTRPGVAALDEDSLEADIAAMRRRSDLVVLTAHWGRNYAPPTDAMMGWAERAASAGADLIIGHHPHEVHPVYLVGRTPVALSLGNYAFGTTGHPTRTGGAILLARVAGRRLTRVELVPLDVQNARVQFRPTVLLGDAADLAIGPIVDASRALGAPVRAEDGRVILDVPPPASLRGEPDRE